MHSYVENTFIYIFFLLIYVRKNKIIYLGLLNFRTGGSIAPFKQFK